MEGSLSNYMDYLTKYLLHEEMHEHEETAANYLKEAESLIESANNLKSLNTTATISTLLEQNFVQKQTETCEILKLKAQIELTPLKTELVGLSQLKAKLKEELSNLNTGNKSNVLAYGLEGTGKRTLLLNLIYEFKNSIRVYQIDFNVLKPQSNMLELIFGIVERNQALIIVLRNVECLFESNYACKSVRLSLIGDLISEMGNSMNRLLIMFSSRPWLLHPAVLNHFKTRIYCPCPNEVEIKQLVHKSLHKYELKSEWENLLTNSKLFDFLNAAGYPSRLIIELTNVILDKLEFYVRNSFDKLTQKPGAWKGIQSRLMVIKKFKNRRGQGVEDYQPQTYLDSLSWNELQQLLINEIQIFQSQSKFSRDSNEKFELFERNHLL